MQVPRAGRKAPTNATPARTASRLRVVVVDDSEPIRSLLGTLLLDAGCEVVGVAEDGPGSIAIAAATRPDLIIMDYHMPGMNGCDAMVRIHADDPGIAVIIFSSGDPVGIDACLAAGAERHFPKQDITELVAYVGARAARS